MHARMTTMEGSSERLDEGLRQIREDVLPQLQQQDGYKGFIVFDNRHNGELVPRGDRGREGTPHSGAEGLGGRVRSHPPNTGGAGVNLKLQHCARGMVRGPRGDYAVGGTHPRRGSGGQAPRLQALWRPLRGRPRRGAHAEAGPQPRRGNHEFDKYTLTNWGHDPLKG